MTNENDKRRRGIVWKIKLVNNKKCAIKSCMESDIKQNKKTRIERFLGQINKYLKWNVQYFT